MNIILQHLMIFAGVACLLIVARGITVIGRLALVDLHDYRQQFKRRRASRHLMSKLPLKTCHLSGHTERTQDFARFLNC